MYCIWHILLNVFYNIFLHFSKPILHNISLKSLIHWRLSDNQKKKLLKFCFMFLSKTRYMYKANITLSYLMYTIVFMIVYYKCKTVKLVSVTKFDFHFGSMFLICILIIFLYLTLMLESLCLT